MIALQLLAACLIIGLVGGLLVALEEVDQDWRDFLELWAVFTAVLTLYAVAVVIVILCVIFIAAGIVTVTGYSR